MNKQQLQVIERAIVSTEDLFPLNQTWADIHREYNIGLTMANKLKLSRQDKAELILLVKQITGLDLNQHTMANFNQLNREEALTINVHEKMAGQAVKKKRLAIKTTANKLLKINQQQYQLPDSGFLDMALSAMHSAQHDCVLVIENFRCFDTLANMSLNLSRPFQNPLVVYRGDNVYSEHTVHQLLMQLALPVLVMPDIDLQGLVIAQSLPQVAGLVAPSLLVLEQLLNDPDKVNRSLYAQQLSGCQKALNTSICPTIKQIWQLLKKYQAGIVQEYWLHGDVELVVHPLVGTKELAGF